MSFSWVPVLPILMEKFRSYCVSLKYIHTVVQAKAESVDEDTNRHCSPVAADLAPFAGASGNKRVFICLKTFLVFVIDIGGFNKCPISDTGFYQE